MLMKFTPGVNFTNSLCSTFMGTDPKSVKKTDSLTIFFALLGSACVKALRKMLVKSTKVFITPIDKSLTEQVFQRKAYILRKWMTHTLAYERTGSRFYICSLSTKTLVYKGQFEPCQLWKFYADLVNPDYVTSMCLVHTRSVLTKLTYFSFVLQ